MNVQLLNQGTVNKNIVYINDLKLYFSYKTIVAFEHPSTGLICSENIWSNTTGKFLTEIESDKDARIDNKNFNLKLEKLLKKFN